MSEDRNTVVAAKVAHLVEKPPASANDNLLTRAKDHFIQYGALSLILKGGEVLLRQLKTVVLRVEKMLYLQGVVNFSIDKIAQLSAPKFLYFFSPVFTNQIQPMRTAELINCLKNNFTQPIKLLEIGTWFGEGSTQIFFKNIPRDSYLYLIDSWRPYLSQVDKGQGHEHYKHMDDLSFAAFHNTAKKVRAFERLNPSVHVTTIRGVAGEVLQNFAEDVFDFIYVDGSHYYVDVKMDLACAKRVCRKDFSVICGDDYELPFSENLLKISRENLNCDSVQTEQGGFHPGVLLAVYEEFGKVNMKNGFWWIFCKNGTFTTER